MLGAIRKENVSGVVLTFTQHNRYKNAAAGSAQTLITTNTSPGPPLSACTEAGATAAVLAIGRTLIMGELPRRVIMKYIIEIELDNAAFFDALGYNHTPGAEVMRILTYLISGMCETDLPEGSLRDYNGNTVGKSEVIS